MKVISKLIAAGVSALSVHALAAPIIGVGLPSSNPALAGAVVVDFEDVAPGTYEALRVGEVTFSTPGDAVWAGSPLVVSDQNAGQYNTAGNSMRNAFFNSSSDSGFGAMSFLFDFQKPIKAVGFNLGALEYLWTLEAFDGESKLIESVSLDYQLLGNDGQFVGIAANGISRVRLSLDLGGDPDSVLIDNFSYVLEAGPSEVPEPTSLALAGLALAGLAAARRDKRA